MRSITLYSQAQAQQIIARLAEWMTPRLKDGKRLRLSIGEETRSLSQNARMWAMLGEVSRQVDWHGQRLAPEEWKDVLSAAVRGEQARLAMGLDGGVVMLGLRTSKMGKKQFSEFLDFLHATAADRGINIDRAAA